MQSKNFEREANKLKNLQLTGIVSIDNKRQKDLENAQKAAKAAKLIAKLKGGPAGALMGLLTMILKETLNLDPDDYKSCPSGWFDLNNIPDIAKKIIENIPFLSSIFELIGNKLCLTVKKCPDGKEKSAELCYPYCKSNYSGNGPVCWEKCTNRINVGVACRDKCKTGYTDIGGICYSKCDFGFIDDGLICREPIRCNPVKFDKCKSRAPKKLGGKCIGGLVGGECSGGSIKNKKSYVPETNPKKTYIRGVGEPALAIQFKPLKDGTSVSKIKIPTKKK
jgi:hypothetical protein